MHARCFPRRGSGLPDQGRGIGLGLSLGLGLGLAGHLLAADPDPVSAALAAWRQGERTNALQLIARAVEASPQDLRAWVTRAQFLARSGQRAAALTNYDQAIRLEPRAAMLRYQRGNERYRAGRLEDALADFDEANRLDPRLAPQNWQRGIALYQVGRFADGRKQFEIHQTVNPRDVENAAWHFLCTAREQGLEAARRQLIPIEGDGRIPMKEVQALLAGKGSVDAVRQAAAAGDPAERRQHAFYGHLYLALYFEALGDALAAGKELRAAVELADEADYMGDVARVHLQRTPPARPGPAPQ